MADKLRGINPNRGFDDLVQEGEPQGKRDPKSGSEADETIAEYSKVKLRFQELRAMIIDGTKRTA